MMNKAIPILATTFTLLLLLLACNPPVENPVPDQTPEQPQQRGELPERIGMYKAFQAGTVYVHVDHVQEMRQEAGAQVLASGMWRMADRNGNSHDLETVTFGQSGTLDFDSGWWTYPELGDELIHYGGKCESQNCTVLIDECENLDGIPLEVLPGKSVTKSLFQCRCSDAPLVYICNEVYKVLGTVTLYPNENCAGPKVGEWDDEGWTCF